MNNFKIYFIHVYTRLRFKNQSNGVDKTMKWNTEALLPSEISFFFVERRGRKVGIGKRFWFGAIFLLRGWEIANLDIRGKMYALFRDKFHGNGETDAKRGSSQRRNGSRGIRFQFARGVSCMTWMESGRDQTLEKETLERPVQFERLSFNVRDEQEIFPPLRPECRRNPTAIWGDLRERLWSRQLDKFLCVMCCLCHGSNE